MVLAMHTFFLTAFSKSRFTQLLSTVFICFAAIASSCSSDSTASGEQDSPQELERKKEYRQENAAAALESELKSVSWPTVVPDAAHKEEIKEAVLAFYSQNNYQPVWNTYKEGGQSSALLNRLQQLRKEGLEPSDFPVEDLRQQLQSLYDRNSLNYTKIAQLDLLLSANYLLLARQVSKGRIEPGKYYSEWHIRPDAPDHVRNLRLAAEQGVNEALSRLEPDYRQYQLLKEKLITYQQIASRGGWQRLPFQEGVIKPGDSTALLASIRQRLAQETNLRDTSSHLYTDDLQEVVKTTRYRYGLADNSAHIDKELIEALNVPVEERIRQLKLNLERSRWLTEPMGERYVLVNLPEYKLRVVENGEPELEMKVVIGEVVNTTPIFSDSMEYLVFAPYWNVPARIAREEILPYAKEDPSYLERKHFEVVQGWEENTRVLDPYRIDWQEVELENFPYRVRQKPGPRNSLGLVKFIFPNNKAIYLHDTPADHLFKEYERGFSHGCIRVEKPALLASYLLPESNLQEVKKLMQLPERKVVHLEEEVPVYLVYFTAVVDSDGHLRFLPDIYGLDDVQQKALQSS